MEKILHPISSDLKRDGKILKKNGFYEVLGDFQKRQLNCTQTIASDQTNSGKEVEGHLGINAINVDKLDEDELSASETERLLHFNSKSEIYQSLNKVRCFFH